MKFLEQRYQGGKEQFKKDFVTFVNRIDEESKKIDFTMQSTREPMMTKETDKISGYTSYQ
jgi:preprotein translocase subunit SecE